ncbi:MAG: mandelate racemase/muconate lactonizing enzyme family protein, partial [Alphaproteobacteria bacterium]|nr:mandelate racemase/muconate lactonizing enzyme family protein [Alphaproteobacteria bacterium]
MKVEAYEIFRCDAGWRTFSFLKLVADEGLVGWSEYNESFGSPGLSAAIETLMPSVLGMDPMDIELVNAVLATRSVQSRGGIARQAVGAIENALLDLKGKALGVPVYQLFGGKLRERIPVYWSHCGSYRMRNPDIVKTPPVRTYDDMTRLGAEVKARGFRALKTNTALEIDAKLEAYRPGFVVGRGFPERNWDDFIATSAAKTVEAFRAGCGPDIGIMLDTNFHFRTEGFRRIAEAVGPAKLTWLELDMHDPQSIALIRRDAPCPIASGETLLERRDFRPYFEHYAFDTAIVDVIWNGFAESLKIAAL